MLILFFLIGSREIIGTVIKKGDNMASYNRVIMMGNLTRDPEYKQLSSGQAVCRLGIASNRQFKNKQSGQMTQEVCFIDVDVWGAQADSCKQHLQKGRLVLIEGRLKLDSWDSEGQKRSKHSIVADRVTFLSSQQQGEALDNFTGESASQDNSEEEAPKAKKARASKVQPASPFEENESSEPSFKPKGEINFTDQKPFEDDLPF